MSAPKPFVVEISTEGDFQRLLPGSPHTCGMKSGRVSLGPGEECGEHSTQDREEMLTFLQGQGVAQIGEKQFEVGKGNIAYIPPHTIHNIKNTSDEQLIYVYCVAPAAES